VSSAVWFRPSGLFHLAFGPYPKGVTESELTFDILHEHVFDCQLASPGNAQGEQMFGFWQYRSYRR
jgi:hypothetical protein